MSLPGTKEKRWRLRQINGAPSPMVATDEVRAHLARLRGWGLPVRSIAQGTGVSEHTIARIISGEYRTVQRARAAALLALDHRPRPGQRSVLAVGARRRSQALKSLGYSNSWQAARTGFAGPPRTLSVRLAQPCIVAPLYWAFVELYREVVTSGRRGPSPRVAVHARRLGYAGPLDWDDIDHPDEVPDPTGLHKRRRQPWDQATRERRRNAS